MKNIAILLLACAAPASAASAYLETFSNDNNEQGWFHVSNGTSGFLSQIPATDVLDFGDSDSTFYYVAADVSSSGGVFVGDYSTGGVYEFTFDLTINTGSSVTELYFEISNLTEDETWQYSLTLPVFGVTNSFTVPLGGAGWVQTSGAENFSFILGQSEDIGIVLASTTAGPLSGSVDNFASVPEPSAAAIAALGLLTAVSRRRRSR